MNQIEDLKLDELKSERVRTGYYEGILGSNSAICIFKRVL